MNPIEVKIKNATEKNIYNDEPVHYCKTCLSLRIMEVPFVEDTLFCDDCNSTEIGTCSIEEWEEMFKNKYGHKFINYGREETKNCF